MNPEAKITAKPNFEEYYILIVDDTPANLGVIVDYLRHYGFGIMIARSGESALQKARYAPPDIILLDVLMPDMDGFETCRQLKADEITKDIPVIFMTSLTSPEDKVKGFEAGAVDYVTKPLYQEEVLARITTHLRLRDLTLSLQEKNRQLELSSRTERERMFEAVNQQREQLRNLANRLTEVQEAERKQLARELHDHLGQVLTAIRINSKAINYELPSDCDPKIRERLNEISTLTDQTMEEIRELSINLRPPMLDDLGLVPTLRWYIKQYANRLNIEAKFDVLGLADRLTSELETTFFRVVQEALTNIARHAQATSVHVRLHRKGSAVVALIEDNGQGFDVAKVMARKSTTSGTGLLGMRERVTLLGGYFDIQSRPGHGAQLRVEIPQENSDDQDKDTVS